jgi:hypothetical protein
MNYECDGDKLAEIKAIAVNNRIGGMSVPMAKRIMDIIDSPTEERRYHDQDDVGARTYPMGGSGSPTPTT